MSFLLDTNVFLWWMTADPRLSSHARERIADRKNTLFLSAASAWEIVIKWGLGKLHLPEPPGEYVVSRMSRHRIQGLPVELRHALHVSKLPDHHGDPFDRILIAQSQLENLPILTADPLIARYPVELIW